MTLLTAYALGVATPFIVMLALCIYLGFCRPERIDISSDAVDMWTRADPSNPPCTRPGPRPTRVPPSNWPGVQKRPADF